MPGPIVFIGDSITDCDRRTDPLGLGGGYVDLVTGLLRDRGDDSVVINSGVSGDRIEHLGLRWQADALDHAPAVLSIHIGVNDTLVAFYGVDRLRFRKPVYVGDSVVLEKRVAATRATGPNNGLVTFHSTVRNQHGDSVLTYEDTLIVRRRAQ